MADENKDQEKTEEATPKRKQDSREKGQVAKSRDLSSVAVLGSCLIYFYFGAPSLITRITGLMKSYFRESGQFELTVNSIHTLALGLAYQLFLLLIPVLLVAFITALIVNVLQVGFVFSTEPITPKFSKIDPIKGFGRLFSTRSLVEFVKNILKLVTVALVAFLTIAGESDHFLPLIQMEVNDTLGYIASIAFKILYTTCWLLVVLAVLDYAYQRYEHNKSLKMTKQEIKEENKQSDGDPLIKSRIRRMQREIARKRMMAAVPKADVVITNPTHLAVAIRYDPDSGNAPRVVAKGADLVAEKIKEIARNNGVPIVENKPVAQILYKMVDMEQSIPENLYRAIAEILAHVYSLKQKRVSA